MVYTEFALTLYRMENKAFTLQLLNQKKKKTPHNCVNRKQRVIVHMPSRLSHTLCYVLVRLFSHQNAAVLSEAAGACVMTLRL